MYNLTKIFFRFPLPGIYRIQVWQLLLGILPKYTTSTEFVWCQRAEQYKESERALVLSKKITANTEQRVKIAAVWLLERNWLKVGLLIASFTIMVVEFNVYYILKTTITFNWKCKPAFTYAFLLVHNSIFSSVTTILKCQMKISLLFCDNYFLVNNKLS